MEWKRGHDGTMRMRILAVVILAAATLFSCKKLGSGEVGRGAPPVESNLNPGKISPDSGNQKVPEEGIHFSQAIQSSDVHLQDLVETQYPEFPGEENCRYQMTVKGAVLYLVLAPRKGDSIKVKINDQFRYLHCRHDAVSIEGYPEMGYRDSLDCSDAELHIKLVREVSSTCEEDMDECDGFGQGVDMIINLSKKDHEKPDTLSLMGGCE